MKHSAYGTTFYKVFLDPTYTAMYVSKPEVLAWTRPISLYCITAQMMLRIENSYVNQVQLVGTVNK